MPPIQQQPARATRFAVAVVVAFVGAYLVASYNDPTPPLASDFDHLWVAARIYWGGGDPYAATGPGRANAWPWPLFYPAPALLLLGPLVWLPLAVARLAFAAATAGVLAYVVTRDGWHRLPVFGSYAFYYTMVRGQWSPLVLAALMAPALSAFLAAKPTVGAAAWIARPTRHAAIGGVALVIAATIWLPSWIAGWRAGFDGAMHFRAPVTLLGGPTILLALLRWRRPEARAIAALACVPQTLALYEALPLFIVPSTVGQASGLALATYATWVVTLAVKPDWTGDLVSNLDAFVPVSGAVMIALLYLPCVLLVLRRPNVGPLPAWLERQSERLPTWLQGAPTEGRAVM